MKKAIGPALIVISFVVFFLPTQWLGSPIHQPSSRVTAFSVANAQRAEKMFELADMVEQEKFPLVDNKLTTDLKAWIVKEFTPIHDTETITWHKGLDDTVKAPDASLKKIAGYLRETGKAYERASK